MINFKFSKHCLKRMKARGVTIKEIITALRYGTVITLNDHCQRYDFADLRIICDPAALKLITVFRLSMKNLMEKNMCRKSVNNFRMKREAIRKKEAMLEMSAAA